MGIDHSELKSILRKNVQLFLAEVSPVVSVCLFIEVHEISKFLASDFGQVVTRYYYWRGTARGGM